MRRVSSLRVRLTVRSTAGASAGGEPSSTAATPHMGASTTAVTVP